MRVAAVRVRLIFGPGLGACGVIASSIKGRRGSKNSQKVRACKKNALPAVCGQRVWDHLISVFECTSAVALRDRVREAGDADACLAARVACVRIDRDDHGAAPSARFHAGGDP